MTASASGRGAFAQLVELLEMIKFSHTLFALPFALTSMLVAAHGLPSARVLVLILAAMVTARTAAMTWNRIADRDVDAQNPRTRERALPAGRVSLVGAWALLAAAVAGFVLSTALINKATLLLCPVALVVVLGYSLTKRVTFATHFVLGLALGIAPVGAWLAVRGTFAVTPLWLAAGVATWTAGFDLLYSCQDEEFDRAHGLHSLPARFGRPAALAAARVLHAGTVGLLAFFGRSAGLGVGFLVALLASAVVLTVAHSLVRGGDLSRVGLAFFQANVAVSLLVLTGTAWDVFAGP